MIDGAPRLLFVPVSGPRGRGEYARCVALATEAEARWPGAAAHFILSQQAPYAAETAFATTLLPSSPTFHSAAVRAVIERWRPEVVIFDNAGRTAQLRAARRAGAAVVFVSARPRQRRKAFRLRWMRLIDEHWIAYPEFVAGAPSRWERLKLAIMRRPTLRYLDVVMSALHGAARAALRDALFARTGITPAARFILIVPGGGTDHPGAGDAVARFLGAARALAAAGIDTVFVGPPGSNAGAAEAVPRLRLLEPLPQVELAELMRSAGLIVANGGSTLLQALACGKACIGVPIAGDQKERIRRCVGAGAALAAPLESAAIQAAAMGLWSDAAQLDQLEGRALALGLGDGVERAMRALAALLDARRR